MKMISLALGILLLFSTLMSGCGGNNIEQPTKTASSTTTAVPTQAASTYPLKTDVKLTYWVDMGTVIPQFYKSMNETPFTKELEKKTGVTVEYLHPALGQAGEAFNLMLASGDLPDIIETSWYDYPGGAEKAIADGHILKLNDVFDQYAPNLKSYLSAHPEVDKSVKTDSGSYYVYPFLRGDPKMTVFGGIIVRKDWLDDLSLQVPTTIDEWYTVLKAFKEGKNADAPLSVAGSTLFPAMFGNGAFIGAYGIKKNYYLQDGKIKYGPIEPGYREFLNTLRKWYSEGLLDKNFATNDTKILDANMTSGKTGAAYGNAGGSLGKWMTAMKDVDPKYEVIGAPYPTVKKGDKPEFGQKDDPYSLAGSAAITTKCKNVEIAARFLDYAYGEEGNLVYNFGTEGVTYTMENGYPRYTDYVMKNPDPNLPPINLLAVHTRASSVAPIIQDVRYFEQYMSMPQQVAAINTWMDTNAASHMIPRISFSADESAQLSKTTNDINTYVDQMFLKFIMGVESLDTFDKYVEQVRKLGIEENIACYQAAVDRFNKR